MLNRGMRNPLIGFIAIYSLCHTISLSIQNESEYAMLFDKMLSTICYYDIVTIVLENIKSYWKDQMTED